MQEHVIKAAVELVAMTYGAAYIAPNSMIGASTRESLQWLAETLDVAAPKSLRDVDLVALYAIARKNTATALAVAKRKFATTNPDPVPAPMPPLPPEMAEIDLIEPEPVPEPEPEPEPEIPEPARLPDGTPTHNITERVIRYARARDNVYLYGPAGSGKTTMAKHVATVLGFVCYSTGAVDSAHTLIGYIAPGTGVYIRTAFREAFEHGGVFLFDEIDGSDATALVALNQALDNDWYTFPDGVVQKHPDFVVIAAANTVGNGADRKYVGRNQLDAATLNRFSRLPMEYDETLELYTAPNKPWCRYVQACRAAAIAAGINAIISPRATYRGASVIEQGESWEGAANARIFDGMKPDDVKRLKRSVPIEDYN